jgi:hypothetical protein
MTRYTSKNPRPSLRPGLLAIGVAALLALPMTGFGTGAGAQGTGGLGGIPEAPVGHRQPTQADLPPSVRQEEAGNVPAPANAPAQNQNNARSHSGSKRDSGSTGNTPSTGAYGQIPSICTGC